MKVRQGGDYLEGQRVVVSRCVVQLLPIELNAKCLVARRSGKTVVAYDSYWEASSEMVIVPEGEVQA